MLKAFGLNGSAVPLRGGQGTSWRVGDAVVKPWDGDPALLAWQAALLASLDGRTDFRVSVPLRTTSGTWTAEGWSAWRYEPGRHDAGRWHDVIEVGRRLHAATRNAPEPPFHRERTDRWSIGDKVAWGELRVEDYGDARYVRELAAVLRPVAGRPQLIHGDLTGNVLFADGLPPLVIDLSPYWRPPAFASAIVVADALAFEGAGVEVVEPLCGDPDFGQHLLRALIYRIVADHLARPVRLTPTAADPYGTAVDLAFRLAGKTR